MGEVFFKSLKWFLFVTCIICGIWSFEKIEVGGLKYGMVAVLSLGGAYIMSGPWRELEPKPMIFSIISVAGLAFLATLIPADALYVYLALPQLLNYYMAWICLTFLLGIPFMMFIFSKYDK